MSTLPILPSVAVLAYLLGSIPTGAIVGRVYGNVDLTKVGSERTGATNTARALGPGAGLVVLLGDFLKGALAVWLVFVTMVVRASFRMFRRSAHAQPAKAIAEGSASPGQVRVLAAAALASLAAMLAAGLFEYNFGDSEFLMLLLVLITLPFAAARPLDAAADRA